MIRVGALGIGLALLSGQSPAGLAGAGRAALGGDAVLDGVRSFQVSGSLTRTVAGHAFSSDIVVSYVRPDKFLQVATQTMPSPRGTFTITTYEGLNGDQPIQRQDSADAPFPVVNPEPPPATPEAAAQRALGRLSHAQHAVAQFLVPLFLDPGPAYALAWSDGAETHTIDAKGPDGFAWRLVLDPATYLPVRLEWKDKPIVTATRSTTIAINGHGDVRTGQPSPPLPADPTAGLGQVDWRIEWSDYSTADGVTWPHRGREFYGSQLWLEWRLGRFKINPPLKDKLFDIRSVEPRP